MKHRSILRTPVNPRNEKSWRFRKSFLLSPLNQEIVHIGQTNVALQRYYLISHTIYSTLEFCVYHTWHIVMG